jgi:hypothetical protein
MWPASEYVCCTCSSIRAHAAQMKNVTLNRDQWPTGGLPLSNAVRIVGNPYSTGLEVSAAPKSRRGWQGMTVLHTMVLTLRDLVCSQIWRLQQSMGSDLLPMLVARLLH